MAISRRLRFEILRRDSHTCRYCGATAPDAKLTVDHVVPVALGGSDEPGNLVAACADCNGGKSASSPDTTTVDEVKRGALRWAAALRRAAEERSGETDADRAIQAWFQNKWTSWFSYPSRYESGDACPEEYRTYWQLDDSWGWRRTLARWRSSDAIDPGFIEDAIRIAMTRGLPSRDATWRYFCGVVWNEIKQRQELAVRYMVEDDKVPLVGPKDFTVALINQVIIAVGAAPYVDSWVPMIVEDAWAAVEKSHRAGMGPDEQLALMLDATDWYLEQLGKLSRGGSYASE